MKNPQTLQEWEAYISRLAGEELMSQAQAANTPNFLEVLMEEGYSTEDCSQVLLYFARQIVATGGRLPESGAFNLRDLAVSDPVARNAPQMSDEEISALASSYVEDDSPDDFDLEAQWGQT